MFYLSRSRLKRCLEWAAAAAAVAAAAAAAAVVFRPSDSPATHFLRNSPLLGLLLDFSPVATYQASPFVIDFLRIPAAGYRVYDLTGLLVKGARNRLLLIATVYLIEAN